MFSFFSIFVFAFLLSVGIVGFALIPKTLTGRARLFAWAGVAVAMFIGFIGPFLVRSVLRNLFPAEATPTATRLAYVPLGWAAVLTLLALIKLGIEWTLAALRRFGGRWLEKTGLHSSLQNPNFSKTLSVLVVAISIVLVAVGYWQSQTITVEQVKLPPHGSSNGLPPVRIALLSDLHIGSGTSMEQVSESVTLVNKNSVDLVILAGDIWEGDLASVASTLKKFQSLKSHYGCYYVVGNHERHNEGVPWKQAAALMNCMLLDDDSVTLNINGTKVQVAGLTERGGHGQPSPSEDSVKRSMPAANENAALRILAVHRPNDALEYARHGYQLILSGHTHGGQFPPFSFFVAASQPFFHGLYDLKDAWLYVSRGVSFWGPPLRFPWAGELTLLDVLGR